MSPVFDSITSLQNPKVKLVRKLREKRQRDKEGLFIVDDTRDLERALANGYEAAYLLICPDLANPDTPIHEMTLAAPIYEVPREIMQKASYRENPGPVLAVLKQKPLPILQHINPQVVPHILGLVDLRKPGNIGALLRTADAAGFRAIFLIDSALDLYNPNIIRSSTGACFLDNVYPVTSDEALSFFHPNGYTIAAAILGGNDALFATELGDRTAVVMGTEDKGLNKFWVENCDKSVRIPMMGQITDSLNVSVSGAIFMYEVLRQSITNEDSPTP